MKTRKNRMTGTKITVGKAEDLELDSEGGKWVTICEDHGSVCNHETGKVAREWAASPEWCEECSEIIYRTIEEAEAKLRGLQGRNQ